MCPLNAFSRGTVLLVDDFYFFALQAFRRLVDMVVVRGTFSPQ